MAGLDPAIHDFPSTWQNKNVDARDKPGHDGWLGSWVRSALPDRRCVLDAAVAPQRIEPARDLQLRSVADIAVVDLTIIADMADDADGPVLGQAEVFAIRAFG